MSMTDGSVPIQSSDIVDVKGENHSLLIMYKCASNSCCSVFLPVGGWITL